MRNGIVLLVALIFAVAVPTYYSLALIPSVLVGYALGAIAQGFYE